MPQNIDTPPSEDEDDELPLSQPVKKQEVDEGAGTEEKRCGFQVSTDPILVEELSRECIISLTSPHNDPQGIRDELRTLGGIDRLANMGEITRDY